MMKHDTFIARVAFYADRGAFFGFIEKVIACFHLPRAAKGCQLLLHP